MGDGRNCIQTKEKDGYFLQHRPFLIARKIFFLVIVTCFVIIYIYIYEPRKIKKGVKRKKLIDLVSFF